MIGLDDVYKVVVAMAPLYFALILGYGSVKWWKIFTSQQSEAINRFVCFFTLPLFTFDFTSHVNPYKLNLGFMAADAISKGIIVFFLACWARFGSKEGSYDWSITSFSLSTLTNSLVLGVPLLKAMYGDLGVELVVQSSVVQALVWMTCLLIVLEIRRAGDHEMDLEAATRSKPCFWHLARKVCFKLAMNPNSYACFIGVVWASISNRWHIEMPSIVEGSILIMSRAGAGTAMFSMGLFMAMQEKLIACGATLTLYGMVLRFVAGPAAMAIGAISMGLHGDALHIAIIQAAMPQAITSFIFAKEYGLHAEVLSTAVIFGTMVSLPVLIGYYAILGLLK